MEGELCLGSGPKPGSQRLDERDFGIGVGRFRKKRKSFAFSVTRFFTYHPNVSENEYPTMNFRKRHLLNKGVDASVGRDRRARQLERTARRSVPTILFPTVVVTVSGGVIPAA